MNPEQELAELRAMIKRSGLYETDGHESASDGCGKPIFRKSGQRILVCKRRMELEQEKTKLLQQLAAKAREIARLNQLVDMLSPK